MKEWVRDELAVARVLGGQRRAARSADVACGKWRLDVRRRKRFKAAGWVELAIERAAGDPSAVVIHCADAGRWVVLLSLEEFRRLLRLCGEMDG